MMAAGSEARSSWPAMDDGRPVEKIYEMADSVFALLDTNGDGEISDDELRSWLSSYSYKEDLVAKIFSGIDFDASGAISGAEFRDAFVKFPTLRTAPGLGRLENVAVRSTWPALDDGKSAEDIWAMADAVFANLDIDGDGKVSEDELRERLSSYTYRDELVGKMFSSIDLDSSGDISVDELRKAFVNYPTLRTAPGLGGLLAKK